MTAALYTICSSLHSEVIADASSEAFIKNIEAAMGQSFLFRGNDFSDFGSHDADIIYVRTGGTEGIFKSLRLEGDIKLLTSGKSNSLAASMEILSWLRQQGRRGEILHGTPDYIASRIFSPLSAAQKGSGFVKEMGKEDLGGIRLGVIGKPSDWLISSDVDYRRVKEKFNAELVDVPISELIDAVKASGVNLASFAGSEAIYEALKGLVAKYRLGGLTLRCFDLLDTVSNTGCLALARLNAEGIPSSCEGDIPALISMAILQKRCGCPGFQCNLSRIEGDRLLFAHCTIPLTMVTSFKYTTHFESGIGTAIKGELPLGEVIIFKLAPDLEHCVEIPARIAENRSEEGLCRTQIIVEAPGAASYFLTEPLANHHVVAPRG